MSGVTPPVLVCENPKALPGAAGPLLEAGWAIRAGFALPVEPWDLTRRKWACQGVVASDGDAEAATWALVRGCALIVAIQLGAPPDFLGDLSRAGRPERISSRQTQGGLTAVEKALLSALAEGQSMQQAAANLYLSGRTAQRRIASARAALQVRTTREAVLAWTQLQR